MSYEALLDDRVIFYLFWGYTHTCSLSLYSSKTEVNIPDHRVVVHNPLCANELVLLDHSEHRG